jgi:hypothetical protein
MPHNSLPIVDLHALPFLPLDHLIGAPAHPGVYLALDAARRVWYVGMAKSLRSRLTRHERIADFHQAGVLFIAWMAAADESICAALEESLIAQYRPPLNHEHRGKCPPLQDNGISVEQEVCKFLQLRQQERALTQELNHLKPNIVSHCLATDRGKIFHPLGTIHISTRRTWTYTPLVADLTEHLQNVKIFEQNNGLALVSSETIHPVVCLKQSQSSAYELLDDDPARNPPRRSSLPQPADRRFV